MGIITSDYVDKYFEQRPQLKKPENQQGMYRLEQEWVPLVRSLIAIAEGPCNTQMHMGTKPCAYNHKSFEVTWHWSFCPHCGRGLRQ